MSVSDRFNEVLNNSFKVAFTDKDKFILMSDVHRGDNSWSDNFAHNKNLYLAALRHYYNNGFTYVELGDGDELWENNCIFDIINTHYDVFYILKKFIEDNRLYMLYGNHDFDKSNEEFLNICFDDDTYGKEVFNIRKALSKIVYHEGLILDYKDNEMLLLHGHQGDLINENLMSVSRYLVNHLWRFLENHLGFKDPTSPASNSRKKKKLENKVIDWIKQTKQFVIMGHTHNPTLPKPGNIPFVNTGSCVHPHSITGIEIKNGKITLVCWRTSVNAKKLLYIDRKILAGPYLLDAYFSENCSYTFNGPNY